MAEPTIDAIEQLIWEIDYLSKVLSLSVPIAGPGDKIYHVIMHVVSEEGEWPTFNCKFDLLFGIDCIDPLENLLHLWRGEFGMDTVAAYLKTLLLERLSLNLCCQKCGLNLSNIYSHISTI